MHNCTCTEINNINAFLLQVLVKRKLWQICLDLILSFPLLILISARSFEIHSVWTTNFLSLHLLRMSFGHCVLTEARKSNGEGASEPGGGAGFLPCFNAFPCLLWISILSSSCKSYYSFPTLILQSTRLLMHCSSPVMTWVPIHITWQLPASRPPLHHALVTFSDFTGRVSSSWPPLFSGLVLTTSATRSLSLFLKVVTTRTEISWECWLQIYHSANIRVIRLQ